MKAKNNISAFILCGGKSSRMGTEKGLVNYNNQPFIQLVIDAIVPITTNIFLVTDNQEYTDFNYPLVADVYKNKGPVGGIFSALDRSETENNLILSCDIPKISTNVIKNYLINNISDQNDVIFLSDDKNVYPLIGIYNKSVKPKFSEAIKSNKIKLLSLLNELNCQVIKVNPRDFESLKNINTQDELKILEKEISKK